MQINLLHKVLNFVLNNKFIILNKNYFCNKILQDKLLYIHRKTEVPLPQIINTNLIEKKEILEKY